MLFRCLKKETGFLPILVILLASKLLIVTGSGR